MAPARTSRARTLGLLVVALGVVVGAAACTDDAATQASDPDGLVVVTTVSPITSIAANIIGDRAEIRGIVPEGTNSHTYEPTPSVSELFEAADVVFANGLRLEEPTLALARDVASDATVVTIGDEVIEPDEYIYDFSFPEEEGRPNPHLWTETGLAVSYARVIAGVMADIDPDRAAEYEANLAAFEVIVSEFDAALEASLDTVPVANRKLVTYHDAYAYWAEAHGWRVVGAIEPRDFGDPSPRDVVGLIEQIREEQVPAVFGSEVFPSPVLEQIAAETGAAYVADLRDDDLPGEPGDPEHSWLALMRFNYVTIIDVLGGDASALQDFEVRNVGPDTAEYPQ